MQETIKRLTQNLQKPLPGKKVQYEMAAADRTIDMTAPPTVKKAGVMALFYPQNEEWNLVLIERQSLHPKDKHAGQISFPGGKKEDTDRDMIHTALREVEEEIGVPSDKIEVLGNLTPLYIPVSNFLVQPVVGIVQEKPLFVPQPSEVKTIIETPLSVLRKPETRQKTDIEIHSYYLRDVPYFNVQEHVVWGATAMMLNELLVVME